MIRLLEIQLELKEIFVANFELKILNLVGPQHVSIKEV